MFGPLFLLFVVVPVVEMWLLIQVGSAFGAIPTIGAVLFTGVLGASLARREGILALTRMAQASNRGELPTAAMFDGMAIFVGGAFLLTPGFVTDVFGFSLLLPWSRDLLRRECLSWFERRIRDGNVVMHMGGLDQNSPFVGGVRPPPPDSRVYDQTFDED